MTKIMLVEDDKSLREIYGVRLLAEGYDIVSAGDGEEALAVAIKERPALIISDVMMPKISGFDMLDILRSTTETRSVKVIMMTALSSEEQRARGEQLGADRYLVKSQVGIEDVVRVVHEVLGDAPGAQPAPQPQAPRTAPQPQPAPARTILPAPSYQSPQLATEPPAADHPTALPQQRPAQAQPAPTAPQPPPQAQTLQSGQPPAPAPPPPADTSTLGSTGKSRIIQPINDPGTNPVNINDLLDKELAKEAGVDVASLPPVATTDQERQIVNDQVKQFASQPSNTATNSQAATPEVAIDQNGGFHQEQPQPQAPPANPPQPQQAASTQRPVTPP